MILYKREVDVGLILRSEANGRKRTALGAWGLVNLSNIERR